MLPPGHIAAGFLVAEAVLRVLKPDLSFDEHVWLVIWGMFFSFVPDLDTFYSFIREKSFTVRDPEQNDHRKYWSHAPVLWMLVGLSIFFVSKEQYWQIWGILFWLCSWSHFVLDSVESGIMWFWPFSKKKFAFRQTQKIRITTPGFFAYWINFLKLYSKYYTFYFEIFIIISALLVFKQLYF